MIFIEPGLSPATCHGPQFCYHKSFCESRSPWRSFWWCRDKRIFLCLGCPLCRVRSKASMALSDWRCGFTLMSSLLSVLFCKGCLFSHNMIVRKCLSAGINIGCLRSLASTSLWIVSYPSWMFVSLLTRSKCQLENKITVQCPWVKDPMVCQKLMLQSGAVIVAENSV